MLDLRLAFRRIKFSLELNLIILIGMGISVLVVSSFPVYLDSLDRQSFRSELAQYVDNHSEAALNTNVTYPFLALNIQDIEKSDNFVRDSFKSAFQISNVDMQRQIRTGLFEFNIPREPSTSLSDGMIRPMTQGYFLNISKIDEHVTYIKGNALTKPEDGSYIPVAVESRVAQEFGLQIGTMFTADPAFGSSIQTHASQSRRLFNTDRNGDRQIIKIVGIFEPVDTSDEFWRGNINDYMMPYPPMETGTGLFRDGIGIRSEDVLPYVVLIADHDVLVDQLGKLDSGSVAEGSWNMVVGSEFASEKSRSFISNSLNELSNEITVRLPGASVDSPLNAVLNESKRQRLSAYVPLLILSSVMVIGIYIFIFITSIYVVKNRNEDSLLMWSRGFSIKVPALYYLSEGLIFFVICVVIIPFLAVPLVSGMGLIPPFNSITNNELLPARIFVDPFLYAALSAGVNLLVYISAGLIGWNYKVRSQEHGEARNRQKPFFQRYYLDYTLLVCSLILIWEMELNAGVLASGQGEDREINELLLISPILFLLSVVLIFFRLFPQIIRFVSGESKVLIYWIGYVLVIMLGTTSLVNIFTNDVDRPEFVVASFGLLTVSLICFTIRSTIKLEIAAVLLSVASLLIMAMLVPYKLNFFTFELSWILYIVPAMMVIFLLSRQVYSRAPLWFFLVTRNFSRDSSQYMWIIILLAISSGILVFGTTLSLTMTRSMKESVLHQIGTDGRITSSLDQFYRPNYSLEKHRQKLMANSEVGTITRAMRTKANTGSTPSGYKFQLLAFDRESEALWSRSDYSSKPMESVLGKLVPSEDVLPIVIPSSATHIGLNLKFDNSYPNMTTKLVLIGADGTGTNLSMGVIKSNEWTRVTADIPDDVVGPSKLSSIQFLEPGSGLSGSSGSVEISDVFYLDSETVSIVEDFEEFGSWAIIPTSEISSDNMIILNNGSIEFNFGKHTNSGVRGMYWAGVGEFVPAVASETLLSKTGLSVGDFSLIRVKDFVVVIKIVDKIRMFATIPTDENGFLLTDLDTSLFHLNLVNPLSSRLANELLFTLDSDRVVSTELRKKISLRGSDLLLMHEETANLKKDVFFSIGMKILIYSIVSITIFMACMGYLIHILCSSRIARSQSGSLRMVGISKAQLFTISLMENSFVVLIGFVIGFWAGLEMCTYVISSVIVSSKGLPVMPPPIMSIDWISISIGLSFFVVVFLLIVLVTTWKSSISNLGVLSRTE